MLKKYLLILLLCSPIYALTLYRVDNHGQITYSNEPVKNSTPIEIQDKEINSNQKLQSTIANDANLQAQWQTNQQLHQILQKRVVEAFAACNKADELYQQALKQNQQLSSELKSIPTHNQAQKNVLEKKFLTSKENLVKLKQQLDDTKKALTTVQQQLNSFHEVLVKFKQ